MSLFGIPPVVAPEPHAVNPELVQEAQVTIDSLQRLSGFKPFTMWFIPRVQKRVDELTAEILEGDLCAAEVMERRLQRKEAKGIIAMLKADYEAAGRVIDGWKGSEAMKKQVTPPLSTVQQVTPPFESAATPLPGGLVNELVDEFGKMFSPFDKPVIPPSVSESKIIPT